MENKTVGRLMAILKEATNRVRIFFLFLCTIVALAMCYYFIIALPSHNRAVLQLEREKFKVAQDEKQRALEIQAEKEKAEKAEDAEKEDRANTYLSSCLKDANNNYTSYVQRNGLPVEGEPDIYRGSIFMWEQAEKNKKRESDACYKQYEVIRNKRPAKAPFIYQWNHDEARK